METIAILDFETTGLSPSSGDRVTEIAVLLVRDGQIIDRFQSLMNAGRNIPSDVVRLTGITNEMISSAPPVSTVMREAARFVGKHALVAHNASFDRRFWRAELESLNISTDQRFACTMLIARRIYPNAPNHKLPTLANMLSLPRGGRAHRAMADAEMASHLLHRLQRDISRDYGLRQVGFDLIAQLQNTNRAYVPTFLRSLAARV